MLSMHPEGTTKLALGAQHPQIMILRGVLANKLWLGSPNFSIKVHVLKIMNLLCVEPSRTCFQPRNGRRG